MDLYRSSTQTKDADRVCLPVSDASAKRQLSLEQKELRISSTSVKTPYPISRSTIERMQRINALAEKTV
jgi:hypothetical protein